MKELLSLFWLFAKIGAVTIGGGYAMLPMLEREIVDKRPWVTKEELMDYFAIGQCTPGVIAVNTSTFIGYKRKGILGGISATLGMITPSIIFILIIAIALSQFMDNVYVKHAFAGVNVAVAALIVSAVLGMAKGGIKDWFTFAVALVSFSIIIFLGVSPVFAVIGSGVVAIIYRQVLKMINKSGGSEE